ncbi:MAG: DNA recombination protein RmuC [Brevundimonas sp.]|jgi:DNA recombination protein RmuC|uniref:DNA recombination protein RmuC n=1 Tax=Brevundimonas sp. TaxID=1871086 RepID=UPI0039195C57
MNEITIILAVLLAVFAGAFLWVFARWQRTTADLRTAEGRIEMMEDERASAAEFVRAQAARSAEDVAARLVARASETFQAQDRVARERVEAQLKPVAETLEKFREQLEAVEKVRAADTGGLKEQLALLMQANTVTRDETRRLTEALRGNTGRRGRWGEQTCRNVLEAAGMAGRFDFVEQSSRADDEGRQSRPDFLVRLPGGGMFVIDAKVPLSFEGEDEADETARDQLRSARIAASLKAHVRGLGSKAYQDQFAQSPDFVAMFVPGDAFLSSALDHEPDLMTQAMNARVVIVTPSTLFALCKAVAYGWRAEEQSANADKIAALGKELYKRLSVMGAHAAGVGADLDRAVRRYNQFVGSLESQVMVQARRFEDLQADHQGKALPELAPVDSSPRALTRPELIGTDGSDQA